VCSFAALTLHTLHTAGRATRAGAKAPASACALARRTVAISAPSTKPQPINYNRIVPQSRPTNPHRNLSHQHPYPAHKHKIGYSSSPSPPEGVKGRGGSGGKRITQKSCTQPSPNPLITTAPFPNAGPQTRTATSRTNTPLRPKTTKLAVQAPLHPGGGEGAGGKRGVKQRGTNQRR